MVALWKSNFNEIFFKKIIYDIENNTWAGGDMKFIFELEHKKINSYLQASMY
jgi:hypothetical protein